MKKTSFGYQTDINRSNKFTVFRKSTTQLPNMAVASALAYTGVKKNEIKSSELRLADGMYEITFSTDWLHYELFVNRETNEIIGCNFEPVTVNFAMGRVCCNEP